MHIFKRFCRTIRILSLCVFYSSECFLLNQIHRIKQFPSKPDNNVFQKNIGNGLRKIFERSGTIFIKLGQVFISEQYDCHPCVVAQMAKLQDDVLAHLSSFEVNETLGDLVNKFSYFDIKPLACGCAAQVHLAYLHTGEKVAVKIKGKITKDDIEDSYQLFVWLLNSMLFLGYSSFSYERHKISFLEWKVSLMEQLNITHETEVLEKTYSKYVNRPLSHIIIPKPHLELCTPNIIVMDFLEGVNLSRTDPSTITFEEKTKIVKWVGSFWITSIMFDNIMHADLHPGNIKYIPNSNDDKIGIMDFGVSHQITMYDKKIIYKYLACIYFDDSVKLAKLVLSLLITPKGMTQKEKDIIYLKFIEINNLYIAESSNKINLLSALRQTGKVIQEYNCSLHRTLDLFSASFMCMEITCRKFDSKSGFTRLRELGNDVRTELQEVYDEDDDCLI